MKRVAALLTAWIIVSGCAGGKVSFDELRICEQGKQGDASVIKRVSDKEQILALYDRLRASPVLVRPPEMAGPLRRLEFVRGGKSVVYEFAPYRDGQTTLVLRAGEETRSVFIKDIRNWCRSARVDFETCIRE